MSSKSFQNASKLNVGTLQQFENIPLFVTVSQFGAVGDGVADDTAAIQAALNASACVHIPTGTYKISSALTVSKNGATILGDSFELSVLTSSSTTAPMISINGGLNGVNIQGIKLTRSVTAASGADGIKCNTVSIGQAYIGNILVEKQFTGINLGATDYSLIQNVISQQNIGPGVAISTTSTDGAAQWSINGLLCQKNGAQGLLVQSVSGPAQMTLGSYRNINTYANTGTGIAFAGSSGCPIQGIRINGAFVGEDANSEIYLNTYGGQHQISNVFAELAGRSSTGPTLSTPLSNIGSGFEVTSNNADVLFTGCHSNGNSLDGFYLAGSDCVISGCRATNNGLANVSGRQNGIYAAAGFAIVVSSSRSGNTGAGVSQKYGVFAADGNNVSIVSCDLRNNATATTGAIANSTYFSLLGNLPNTMNTIIAGGAVLVGGGAGGGASIPGGINVAGGLAKNNVAYVNP